MCQSGAGYDDDTRRRQSYDNEWIVEDADVIQTDDDARNDVMSSTDKAKRDKYY